MIYTYLDTTKGKASAGYFDSAVSKLLKDRGLENEPSERMVGPGSDAVVEALIQKMGEKDLLFVKSARCLGSRPERALEAYLRLFIKTAGIVFVDESYLDTAHLEAIKDDYGTKEETASAIQPELKALIIHIFRKSSSRSVRIKEGIANAKAAGKMPGRKKGSTVRSGKFEAAREAIVRDSETFGGPLSDPELIRKLGLSRNTYYKYKSMIRSQKSINKTS